MRVVILVIVLCNLALNSSAQKYGLKTSIGTTHYLGDLAPYSHNLSFTEGHVATTIAFTSKANEFLTLFSKVLIGKLSGSDTNAIDPARRRRNLNFTTDLYEFGFGTEISLLSIWPKFQRFGIDFYLTGGISVYHINPRTMYNGQWYFLQPLATEGQGIPGNHIEKYKLWQIAFPMGIGFSFDLSPQISMGFEIVPRYTTTDYIDDVSSDYIGTQQQIDSQGTLTAALANRMGEYIYGPNSTELIFVQDGTQRGDPNDRDWYLFNSITFGFGLSKGRLPIKKIRL